MHAMKRKYIHTLLLAAVLSVTGCESMMEDHPVDRLRSLYETSMALFLTQSNVSVSGRVILCGINNEGNPNVLIHLGNMFWSRSIYTDASGNFSFTNVKPGAYTITASKQGHRFIPERQDITVAAHGLSNVTFETSVTWERTIGGSGWDKAYSVIQTNDCSYIAAGYSDSHNDTGNKDFFIVKLSINGNEEWRKTFGGGSSEIAYSINKTNDTDHVIACGYTFSNTFGLSDFYITRINVNNDTDGQWEKHYGGSEQDVAYSVKSTSDNGFIVAGYTESEGAGESDFRVLKLDADGDPDWVSGIGIYGDIYADSASSIIEVSGGGYLVVGNSEDTLGNYDVWILRINAAGEIIWDKMLNKGDYNEASDVQQTSDGGFIITGYTNFGYGSYWIIKLDSNGDTVWEKLDDGTSASALNSIRQTLDGGYIGAGRVYSHATADNDLCILKLDHSGATEWRKTFDGKDSYEDIAYSISQTSDGGYIVAGYTTTYANKTDIWLLKLNKDGEILQ
jgi:uncharacterized delta-60 repeat protein